MRHAAALLACLIAAPASAEWRALTGVEITAALTGRTLVYDGAWQEFAASGQTLYHAGRDSLGRWRVEDDLYCSQWPPAEGWACYGMSRDDATGALRFEGASGDITEGRYAE